MNYRHAFHAGNHTEVFKHAALTFVLEHLRAKPQPFAVLDTHAGIGAYDLTSEEARRTGEADEGAARVLGPGLRSAPAYIDLVQSMNPDGLSAYPGSPEIIRRFLRDGDRLMACELHPADAETLKALYRKAPQVQVHQRDGYEAMGALLPPPERRGLVFIDPPFERKDETARVVKALRAALRRWSSGIYMVWYPAKDNAIHDALAAAVADAAMPKALSAVFSPYAAGETSLPGSGLLVVNAPWKLDERLRNLCEELSGMLGTGHGAWRVDWLTPS